MMVSSLQLLRKKLKHACFLGGAWELGLQSLSVYQAASYAGKYHSHKHSEICFIF